VRFQGRDGVLIVMEMGGMAQVYQDPHLLSLWDNLLFKMHRMDSSSVTS